MGSAPELSRQLAARFGLERSEVHNGIADCGAPQQFVLPVDVMEKTRIYVSKRPVRVGDRFHPVTRWAAYSKQALSRRGDSRRESW
ncbi:hypothetical protein AB0M12_04980 [Nocardia vinacea]|uniref:hypothetical protein n=1 Tax=Nocardia vinacea TaxID=96468 RepID=UPI00342F397D